MAAIPLIIENQHDGQWYVIDLPDNWVPQGGVITISVTDQPFPTRNAAQHVRPSPRSTLLAPTAIAWWQGTKVEQLTGILATKSKNAHNLNHSSSFAHVP